MNPAKFLESRKHIWDRLDSLTKKAGRKGVRTLDDGELRELTRLYPTVATDVARARMYGMDANTMRRLNQLAIGAHGLLYRRERARPLKALWTFFSRDYPRLFRRLWPCFAISFALFSVCAMGAYTSVRMSPSSAYLFVPLGLDVEGTPEVTAGDIGERYRKAPGGFMVSAITTNNIQVAIYAFVSGITAGIGTCAILILNGMMLGGFFGHFANHGLLYACCEFLVPHGALEIFSIILAGAAGLRLGFSLALPGKLTRKASLRKGAREAMMLMLGTVPMFIAAGIIESFVTPAYINGGTKIIIGLSALGITMAYLLFVGLRTAPSETAEYSPD